MPVTKEQQRNELHKTIWSIADDLRGGFFRKGKNLTTYNLARINMFLPDINSDKFDITLADALTDPAHWDDEPFDVIVADLEGDE